MTAATLTRRQHEVDEQVRHVRDLVFVRTLLAERGADAVELAECDAEIERQRDRLAGLARASAEDVSAAA
jgi:hypothetical protein